jgi:hypothetical protein
MAKVFIKPTCGLATTTHAQAIDMQQVTLDVESECAAIRKIAEELKDVDPFKEMTQRGGEPIILKLGSEYCTHTSCPVPAAMIKVVEVAAGMDLPKEIIIELTND